VSTQRAAAEEILRVEHLSGAFRLPRGGTRPVLDDVSFTVRRGAMTAIVGETGSGKTLTALAALGLAPPGFVRAGGAIRFHGAGAEPVDLAAFGEHEFRAVRGGRIAMVFQDSRGALNPVFTIGSQLRDVMRLAARAGGARLGRAEAAAGARSCWPRSACPSRPGGCDSTRTNSPAAPRSASSWRSRWPASRSC